MKQISKIKLHLPDNVLKYSTSIMMMMFSYFIVSGQIVSDTIQKKYNYPVLSFRPDITNTHKPVNWFTKFEKNALPFFCRIEHKIESDSKIAFRFRLGDLNYVNLLENKR